MPQIAGLPMFSAFRVFYPEVVYALLAGGVIAYTTVILRTRRAPAGP
jgi:hypothetical protein